MLARTHSAVHRSIGLPGATVTSPFSKSEQDLFRPSDKLTVSEFADRYRELPPTDPRPGRWHTSFTEYWREPMDSYNDPKVEEVIIQAASQTGKSRLQENTIAYVAACDPTDLLYVVPRDADVRTVVRGRIRPMIESSPRIAQMLDIKPHDAAFEQINFKQCSLYMTAASSAAGLAAKTCGVVLLDEIGKFKSTIRNEGNPVDLARQRTNAFEGRRKIIVVSSPTTPTHGITPEYDRSDKRQFYVPCPNCQTFQHLVWNQVKYVDDLEELSSDPDVPRSTLAWYECIECQHHITDAEKRRAVQGGVWCPEGGTIEVDDQGEPSAVGGLRRSVRGYHVVGLLSPIRSFADFSLRWKRASKNRSKLAVFFRSDIGVPWLDRVRQVEQAEDIKEATTKGFLLGSLPQTDQEYKLVAGVDVGKRQTHFVIIAVARGLETWVVDYGTLESIHDIAPRVIDYSYGPSLNSKQVIRVAVDSGWKPLDIYSLASEHPKVIPVKGRRTLTSGKPVWSRMLDESAGQKLTRPIRLFSLDTSILKDKLHSLTSNGELHIPEDASEEFLDHLQNEQKILNEKDQEAWEPTSDGAPLHFKDSLIYGLAAAFTVGLWRKKTTTERKRQDREVAARKKVNEEHEEFPQQRQQRQQPVNNRTRVQQQTRSQASSRPIKRQRRKAFGG